MGLVVTFYITAAIMVISALAVVWAKSPVASLLSLLVTMTGMSVLFVLLHAPFLAALQLLIYAGAVLVLFLFVLMLLSVDRETITRQRAFVGRWLAIPVGILLGTQLVRILARVNDAPAVSTATDGTIVTVGRALFRDYLLPFELTSLLILAAIIGAVALAQRKTQR